MFSNDVPWNPSVWLMVLVLLQVVVVWASLKAMEGRSQGEWWKEELLKLALQLLLLLLNNLMMSWMSVRTILGDVLWLCIQDTRWWCGGGGYGMDWMEERREA